MHNVLLIAFSQFVKLHLIPIITFRVMFRTNLLLQKLERAVNTDDRAMMLAFYTFSHYHLSVYQVSYI